MQVGMSSVVFREIEGRPVVWRDRSGRVHACEGTQLQERVARFWTLCEIDVVGGVATALVNPAISCPICRERMQQPGPSVVPDAGEAPAPTPGPEEFVSPLKR
jgi:hypothetical protein